MQTHSDSPYGPPLNPQDVRLLKRQARTVEADFREALRFHRTSEERSQAEIAYYVGELGFPLDASAVTRIEKGDRGIKLGEAWALAAVLGMDLGDMIPRGRTQSSLMAQLEDDIARQRQRVEDAKAELAGLERELAEARREILIDTQEVRRGKRGKKA